LCDRFLVEDVFDETMNRVALVLVGASHLRNLARFFSTREWQVFDLTTRGWRISEQSVEKKTAEVAMLCNRIEKEKATVIFQLSNNSMYILYKVGSAGETKKSAGA
jgi:hypothetical protein